MQSSVLVSGVNGGIGSAIANYFAVQGYAVFGLDKQPGAAVPLAAYYSVDLAELVDSPALQLQLKAAINDGLQQRNSRLNALVNNAAVQILGDVSTVTMPDFLLSQTVNVAAPLLLSQLCLPLMNGGAIINIGSIHANLTKPGFISYATSKAALRGLTQAMAVDLGGEARVNCIEPAAVATDMLVDSFKSQSEKFQKLESCHPSGKIGEPAEVAELCFYLANSKASFLNGACIGLNGAIAARLHDPV